MKTEYLSSPCFGICKICEPSLIQVLLVNIQKTQYLNGYSCNLEGWGECFMDALLENYSKCIFLIT
jgi:hypothetical protein